jgi:hypothetical protein
MRVISYTVFFNLSIILNLDLIFVNLSRILIADLPKTKIFKHLFTIETQVRFENYDKLVCPQSKFSVSERPDSRDGFVN